MSRKIDIDMTCPYCKKEHKNVVIYSDANKGTCWEDWDGCGMEFELNIKISKTTVETYKKKKMCMICDEYVNIDEYDEVVGFCNKCVEKHKIIE